MLINEPDHFRRFGSSSDAKKPKRLSTTRWCPAALDFLDATVRFLQQGPRALIPQHDLRDERPASIASPCATRRPALVPRSCRLPAWKCSPPGCEGPCGPSRGRPPPGGEHFHAGIQQGPGALIPQHDLRDERPASIASLRATTRPALLPRSCMLHDSKCSPPECDLLPSGRLGPSPPGQTSSACSKFSHLLKRDKTWGASVPDAPIPTCGSGHSGLGVCSVQEPKTVKPTACSRQVVGF